MEPHPQSTNYCCDVYMRVASIRLMDDIRAAFIRGWRLLEGGVYIRKYGNSCVFVRVINMVGVSSSNKEEFKLLFLILWRC